jgi:type II secretory pathway component PulF
VPEEAGAGLARTRWTEIVLFGRAGPKQMAAFCRQFASYLDAGVTMVPALVSLRRQFSGTPLGPVIGRLALQVRRGEPLTDAFAREPKTFDRLFRTMTRVAETRGGVPETLRLLAAHYTARQRLIRQARSALIYPAIVLVLVLALAALMTVFVLPSLDAILQDLIMHGPRRLRRLALPWPTRALVQISAFVRRTGWWAIPLALISAVVGPILLYRTRRGKVVMDELLLFVPVLGPLLRRIDSSRFARTLSALLGAGVDIGSSLQLTADVLKLVPLRRAVLRAREGVLEGATLGSSLAATRRFPADLVAVVDSGEETGRLPEVLIPLSDDYEEHIEHVVRDLGSLIQPAILLFLGGIVFFVAVAFLMGYTTILSRLVG